MLSRYFIARPIFASVCAAFIVIAGFAGMRQLPIAQLPNIQPRSIGVSTFYPGANAETLANTVAAPLEKSIGEVQGALYMTSTNSGNGSFNLNVIFSPEVNIDAALLEVNSRAQKAVSLLPPDVGRQGVTVYKSASTSLLVATVYSPDRSLSYADLSNYVRLNIQDEIARLPGVASVNTGGQNRFYSMRIWLQPDKLARLGLTALDVLNAVQEQNSQYTSGRTGEEPLTEPVDFTFTIKVPGRLSTPEEFEQIILQTSAGGAIVRLKDVARVELGSNRYDIATKLNNQWAIPISVYAQIDTNTLETAELVRARLQELSKSFPSGLAYEVSYDSTIHVRNAIEEVTLTLFGALALVFLVVFVFMGSWRATLIPMLAVPVSIIGAFVAMYFMNFTINTITLFGMVFAVGIVVDDAIIVIENVQRIMQTQGLDARTATEQAMDEVTRPIIAIVLILAAVFMPIAFVPGLTGIMYRQFAVTIAGSVIISGFVALTLTPSLCANLLRARDIDQHGAAKRFQSGFSRFTGGYLRVVEFFARYRAMNIVALVAVVATIVWLGLRVPTSLIPKEDRAIIYVTAILPDGASLSRSQAVADELTAELLKHPAVQSVISFAGTGGTGNVPSAADLWVPLKPWSERGTGMTPVDVVEHIEKYAADHIGDARIYAREPPSIPGGSSTGGMEGFIQSRVPSTPQDLAQAVQKFVSAANEHREFAKNSVDTTYRASVPQVRVVVDRDKAKLLGVSLSDLFITLHSNFSAYYINDFDYAGRAWEVQMQSDAQYRAHAEDLRSLHVRSSTGALIPVSSLVRVDETTGPDLVERYNGFPAARIYGRNAEGFSSGAAHGAMEEVARKVLPPGYVLAWSGTSYQERVLGKSTNTAFFLSVLMVFLILAAQYERWTLPFAVIFAVPFAMFGAFVAIWLRDLYNDIFFQIGLVTLVGLAAKNSVLIVEYAAKLQQHGKSSRDAALEATRLRFRPIVMTSAAFVFGVLPLVFAGGAGANARHSIGTGVVGGMLAATFIATIFVPIFYMWIANISKRRDR